MPSKRTKLINVIILPLAAISVSLLPTGCEQRIPVETMGATVIDGDATSECANRLNNALSRLDPASLGVSSQGSAAAISLNEWFERCGDADWNDSPSSELAALVGEETARRANARIFGEADAQHIRTCLLLDEYSQAVEGGTELQRIVNTFYGLVRDVALIDDEKPLALSPFEVLLSGRGTASDRAWLFVAALRQRRIDAVVLTANQSTETRLVGVSTGGKVYLFDVKLGLPVFRPAANEGQLLPQTPATLADLAEADEILGGMGTEKFPYPMKDVDLEAPTAWLVGSASVWSQRCMILQGHMRDSSAVLADPLRSTETHKGLADRVTAMGDGALKKDSIKVWPYSISQLDSFSRLNESDLARLDAIMSPFKARVARELNQEETAFVFGDAKWELFRARIRQLQGAVGDTVSRPYQQIRTNVTDREATVGNSVGEPITVTTPEHAYILHRRAREDAGLWVSVHQYRGENYDAATHGYYLVRRLFEDTIWSQHLRYLLSLSLSSQDKTGLAMIQLAEGSAAGGQSAEGFQKLHDWWQSQGYTAAAPKPEEAANPEPKAEEKPAAPKPVAKPEPKKPTGKKPAGGEPSDSAKPGSKPKANQPRTEQPKAPEGEPKGAESSESKATEKTGSETAKPADQKKKPGAADKPQDNGSPE